MPISDNRLKVSSIAVQSKILESLSLIENKFSIKFDLKIKDNGKTIVFSSHHNYTLKAYQTHGKIVFIPNCEDNEFILNSSDFQFSMPHATKSLFIVSFDDDFDISSIRFSSLKTLQKGISRITVLFNDNFELSNIEYHSTHGESFKKNHSNLLSFDEEALLFKLLTNNNEDIKVLLPEYYIPSAYNFNSEDFKDRLNIYEMMTL